MTSPSPIACVRLPELPIAAHHTHEALERGEASPPDDRALTVHRGNGAAARILYCDATSLRLGIRPGLSLAAARTRATSLSSQLYDASRLAEHQRAVVAQLLAISPRIAVGGSSRFWVEPVWPTRARRRNVAALQTWCEHAKEALLEHTPVTIGIGPTATIAWAAACSLDGSQTHRVVSPEQARGFLDEAPVEVLEVGSEARDVLAVLGVCTVGQLRAIDPISLGMRFGPALASARRRADGVDPRRPTTPRPRAAHEVRVDLEDDVVHLEALGFLLQSASERLAAGLRRASLGALGLTLELKLRMAYGGAPIHLVEVRVGAPLAEARALLELLRTRLEREQLSAPVTAFRLRATTTAPLAAKTEALLRDGPGRDLAAQEVAIGRLRGRLGENAVGRASRVETPSPLERAKWEPIGEPVPGEALPWRRLPTPSLVERGAANVAGRRRRVLRLGHIERVSAPWWDEGKQRVTILAWAELEGPLLVLLHARCADDCDDEWEVVAWVD